MDLAKLVAVFALGAVELWAAIPAGLALNASPVVVGVVAAAGAMLGVLVVVVLGERVRDWVVRRHGDGSETGPHGLIRRIWDRHGVVGLGLLAPLLTGAPMGAALGLALGVLSRARPYPPCIAALAPPCGMTYPHTRRYDSWVARRSP